MTSIDELVDNFEMLGDWEERYRYIIELGKHLPPMDEADKNDANRVDGCMSNVWVKAGFDGGSPSHLRFDADSDAFIVKGLVALLREVYSGHTPREVLELDVEGLLRRIGLIEHLSPTRQNGLHALLGRIRGLAERELEAN